ncbi:MAG: PEP-CTERM sorting domain-containing protein [Steroidobacteraceae bacterium]
MQHGRSVIHQWIVAVALLFACSLSQATPIHLLFTGQLDNLTVSTPLGTADVTGLIGAKGIAGSVGTNTDYYGAGGFPSPVFIGAVDQVFTLWPADAVDFGLQWAGGLLAPSDYSVSACNQNVVCEPYDYINLYRDEFGDDLARIGENMSLTSTAIRQYSYVSLDFGGPSLFSSPAGSLLSLDDLASMQGWTSGSGRFGQAWYTADSSNTRLLAYEGTFKVDGFGTAQAVPEPSTCALLGVGLLVIGTLGQCRRVRSYRLPTIRFNNFTTVPASLRRS